MKRWLAASSLALLVLPACGPRAWYRSENRWNREEREERSAARREDDRLGQLPVRGQLVDPRAGRIEAARVTTNTDEFTGNVSHHLSLELSRTDRFAAFAIPGVDFVGASMTLPANRGWRYLHCHQVHGLADEYRVAPTDVEHDGRVMRGGVIEHINFRLSQQDLQALAVAQHIRFRVCNTIYEFPARSREAFAELLRRMSPPEPSLPSEEPSQEIDTPEP